MPSKEELTQLVTNNFFSATLIRTFGGTLHKANGTASDEDFIIEFPNGGLPEIDSIYQVFNHELVGIRGCEMLYRKNVETATLCILSAADNAKSIYLRIALSRYYPFKDCKSAMRVSCVTEPIS
ncbi:MAG: hypothetical protein RLZZ347_494 [Candidatus Parcubacteria bacterium]|jgi:hypothetical protein